MKETDTVPITQIGDSKILIIDDEPVILEIIKKFLSRYEFHNIATASSYKEGYGYFNTIIEKINTVDLIILDVVLPDGNGFELCKRIETERPNIPVIMISGYEINKIYEKIVEAEADDFLVKPFDGVELAMRVNLHLHKKFSEHNNLLTMGDESEAAQNVNSINIKRNCPYIGEGVNNYIVIDSLGWSKASAVYKVVDKETHKLFAMKIIVFPTAEQGEMMERFAMERDLIARCNHPHIISFHEKGTWGNVPYMIMEYFESIDLEEYLVSHGKMAYKPFCKVALQLADALTHIHQNNIIHRDIKLKNILFNPEICDIKIADFGIAKHPDFTSLTRTGYVMGTPMYMPPEVFAGDKATLSSDIYSFGATMYHLVTGVPPYVADRASDLANHHRDTEPSPITLFRDDIPVALGNFIVQECMAKNPDNRPNSMKDVEERLKELTI
jgi:CheY-like chemotaxis protein